MKHSARNSGVEVHTNNGSTMRSARYAREAIHDRFSLYNSTSSVSSVGLKPLKRQVEGLESIPPSQTEHIEQLLECRPLETGPDGTLVDPEGRRRFLRGINVDGAMKLPAVPEMHSYDGDCRNPDDIFFDGDNVSFVGRPFPLEEAEDHFRRIKSWGYNTIRYLITWEALEHAGPGKYDEDFIEYTIKMVRIIDAVGGLYVFFETHQDVWSRYCGGSGAPMWTLYAAGLQPSRFYHTEAALLHNNPQFHHPEDPDDYPKMIWPSNYKRLACMVMFTLFFSGKNYFPQLCINDLNIQDYLQKQYFDTIAHFWKRVHDAVPEIFEKGCILGFELINEPNCGLMGHDHLKHIPGKQQLRVGTTPTVYQSLKMGMGFACEIDVYKITVTGPQKSGTKVIDPEGAIAWLTIEEAKEIDAKYGWKRDPSWKLGECIFADAKIWKWDKGIQISGLKDMTPQERLDLSIYNCELLLPNFFNQYSPKHKFNLRDGCNPKLVDMDFFTNHNFVEFYLRFKNVVRDIVPDCFVFIQPPVLERPPDIKNDERKVIDSKTIYCPHYYDGMSLMFKTWNTKFNVDTLGIMRGRYFNPVLGIVFGERAIRNCIKKQFLEIRQECQDLLGDLPVLMSETGMPFDMDSKRAYEDGRYYSQTAALDALSSALEGTGIHHTWWCYTSINCHQWGDRWNNEDFSFWSSEDRNLDFLGNESSMSRSSLRRSSIVTANLSKKLSATRITSPSLKLTVQDYTLMLRAKCHKLNFGTFDKLYSTNTKQPETVDAEQSPTDESEVHDEFDFSDSQSLSSSGIISHSTENVQKKHIRRCFPSPDGVRAVSAVVRPFVVALSGTIKVSEFDLKASTFAFTINLDPEMVEKNIPTVIFVPKWHYPFLNVGDIYLTAGYVKFDETLEYLEWYHSDNAKAKSPLPPNEAIDSNEARQQHTIEIKNSSGTLEDIPSREKGYFNQPECPVT